MVRLQGGLQYEQMQMANSPNRTCQSQLPTEERYHTVETSFVIVLEPEDARSTVPIRKLSPILSVGLEIY
jgi:hypothetical protein